LGAAGDASCKKERRSMPRKEKRAEASMALAKSDGAYQIETARHEKRRSMALREQTIL
jgi:hypothetical protein